MSPYIIIVILSVSVVLVACLAYCLNLVYRIYHSKHNLESAFDSFNDPIAIIDNTYTITRVNKPFAQLIGKDFQDILLNRCYAVFRNRTSPCEDCQLQSVLNSGSQGYVSRSPHPHKNTPATISISTFPFSGKHRSARCILEHIRDTTELEKMKADLEKQNERLNHTMKMLKQTQHDIKNELLMARQVQQSIMPQTAPEFPGLHLFLWYQPIETVCGDMYDFIQLSPNRLGIFIGDVSGHSISSALVSMVSKMSLYLHTKKRMTPHLLFELLNEDLIGNIGTSHFLTCFYGIFDRKDNSFTYSRAGIPAPIVIRANGQIVPLASYGTVLGILNDPFVEQRRIYLNKGDRCIFFTDGIYEIEETGNGAVHVYGYKKFVEKLVETCPLPIHEVVPYIKNEFSGFKHEDDYTLIACEAADDHTHALEDKYPGFNALDHLSLLTVTTMAEVDKYISFLEKEMDRNKCTSPAFKDAKNNALHYIKLCLETESDALIKNSVTILHTFTPSDFKICVTARNADFTEHAKQNKSILTNPKGNAVSILLPRIYQK